MSQEEYVTATQARIEMKVSTVTLRKMLNNGTLPFIENPRDKRQKLVARSFVDAWKKENGKFPSPKYARQNKEAVTASFRRSGERCNV